MTKRAKQLREDRTRNGSFNGECSVNNVESSNNGCNPSENIKDLFNKAVEEWKAQYDSEIFALKMELEEVKKSQDLINSQYESLKEKCDKLIVTNQKQESVIKELKAQSTTLKSSNEKETEKVDALEQYGRRQNLEIVGVPLKEGENANEIAIEVAKMLNVSLTPDQISTSRRLQTRPKSTNSEPAASPPIIVRFLSRDVLNQLYANRKLARTASLQEFSLQGAMNVYINENLTQSRKKLFWHAKQKAIASNFKFYWTVNGNVYVRKSSDSDSLLIKNIDDISKIK